MVVAEDVAIMEDIGVIKVTSDAIKDLIRDVLSSIILVVTQVQKVLVVEEDKAKVELDLLVQVLLQLLEIAQVVMIHREDQKLSSRYHLELVEILELLDNQVVDLVRQVVVIAAELVVVEQQDMQCLHQQNHKFF